MNGYLKKVVDWGAQRLIARIVDRVKEHLDVFDEACDHHLPKKLPVVLLPAPETD